MAGKEGEQPQPIIVKKIKKGGGHHGGAWKVAYADFVTAMMAFFLLLWLLNVSTDEQLSAISGYFDPTHPKVSDSKSGAGGILGGLSMSPQGAMVSTVQPIAAPSMPTKPPKATEQTNELTQDKAAQGPAEGPKKVQGLTKKEALEKIKEERRKKEEEKFKTAEDKIKKAIADNPDLAALADHLLIDMTPEGLRIQIIDQEGEPMFPSGSARMYDKTRRLMSEITKVIMEMPNQISVRGHTDASPYGPGATYTNWDLSTDRANASRRVFIESGLPEMRVNNVMGKADTEPLIADNPFDPQNRRISVILLKEELTNPALFEETAAQDLAESGLEYSTPEDEDFETDENDAEAQGPEGEENEADGTYYVPGTAPGGAPIGTFRKTPGMVEFP